MMLLVFEPRVGLTRFLSRPILYLMLLEFKRVVTIPLGPFGSNVHRSMSIVVTTHT